MFKIKNLVRKNSRLSSFLNKIRHTWFPKGLHINNQGTICGLKKYIAGKNNIMNIGQGSILDNVTIHIVVKQNVYWTRENIILKKNM